MMSPIRSSRVLWGCCLDSRVISEASCFVRCSVTVVWLTTGRLEPAVCCGCRSIDIGATDPCSGVGRPFELLEFAGPY
jgi:hypothetical protein